MLLLVSFICQTERLMGFRENNKVTFRDSGTLPEFAIYRDLFAVTKNSHTQTPTHVFAYRGLESVDIVFSVTGSSHCQ